MPNNQKISLQTAIDMTSLYRANRPLNFPVCETFELAAIQQLLSVPGCQFIRIYYGMKENMEMDAILVAANADGDDLLPDNSGSGTSVVDDGGGVIIEDGFRCPPACPKSSPLNSN